MNEKTIAITGATDGIGFEIARELASSGARVLMIGRNHQKGQLALNRIREVSPDSNVRFLKGDLSIQREVRLLAQIINRTESRLDVLINNAGGIFYQRTESEDGHEMTFALNHLAYFLLTELLIPMLRKAPEGRIINTSSGAHFNTSMNFQDIKALHNYNGWSAYQRSKLANILFTRKLAQKLRISRITVNAFHPGFVRTNFAVNNNFIDRIRFRTAMHFSGIPAKEGAKTGIMLASHPSVSDSTGGYFVKGRLTNPSAEAQSETIASQLWELSETYVKL